MRTIKIWVVILALVVTLVFSVIRSDRLQVYAFTVRNDLPWPSSVEILDDVKVKIGDQEYTKFSYRVKWDDWRPYRVTGYFTRESWFAYKFIPNFYDYLFFYTVAGQRHGVELNRRYQAGLNMVVDALDEQPYEKDTLEKALALMDIVSTDDALREYSKAKSDWSDGWIVPGPFTPIDAADVHGGDGTVEIHGIADSRTVYRVVFQKSEGDRLSSIELDVVESWPP